MISSDCNEELRPVLEACAFSEATDPVRTPWLAGQSLSGEGRAGAIVAIEGGLIGLAKNGRGEYRFYFQEANTGKWLYELWTVARSSTVFALLTFTGLMGLLFRGTAPAHSIVLLSGVLLILAFFRRVTSLPVHWALVSAAGRPSLGAGIVPAMLGVCVGLGLAGAGLLLLAGLSVAGPRLVVSEGLMWGAVAGAAPVVAGVGCVVVALLSRIVWDSLLYLHSLRTCGQRLADCSFYTVNAQQAAQDDGLDRRFASYRPRHSLMFAVILGFGLLLIAWPIMGLMP